MDWTKIPTSLITKRYSDYELISIIKFQLLWAELEEQPDRKTALRYMTEKQYETAMTYLDSIATGVGDAVSSVKRKREVEKIRYNKNKNLSKNLQAEQKQTDSRLPNQIRLDKIREDNIGDNSVIGEHKNTLSSSQDNSDERKEVARKLGELIKRVPRTPLDFK